MQVAIEAAGTGDRRMAPPKSASTAETLQPGTGTLDLELRGRRYRARWAQAGTVEHLRVNLRVESGTNGSTRMHVETLDLYSPRSRQVFASRAARRLEAGIDDLEEDLSDLLVAVDKAQRQALAVASVKPASDAVPVMSELERQEAIALLRDPELMDRIAKDMSALGYVGEEVNKKLGYLIAVSRKLAEPLSAIIISQSGAGKSGLAGALERLVPPEEVVFWSRLTPQALYYVEKDFLRRKLVVIEERDGSDAADYSIRALQSKHKLVQAVPVKDPSTGTIQTRTMEVEGPAAFLETTTRLHINPENASRCFEIYLDETPAQTERVQHAQRAAKTAEGLRVRDRARAIARAHQNAQRLLEPVSVVIPYAQLLTFPSAWLRTRRDNLRLLNLVEASAFVHQLQRARTKLGIGNGVECIEATVEDYAIAYALASSVLSGGLDELRRPVRELFILVGQKARELAASQGILASALLFTQRDVRDWSGLPHHQVKIALRELEELEYVEVERSQRGGRHRYRLVSDVAEQRAPLAGLLTPVELYNRIEQQSAQRSVPMVAQGASVQTPKPAVAGQRSGKSGKQAVPTPFRKKA